MPDPDEVTAFIERVVARAQIPGRARRDDLRRELRTHFEDSATSPAVARQAIRRVGADALLAAPRPEVYRGGAVFWKP